MHDFAYTCINCYTLVRSTLPVKCHGGGGGLAQGKDCSKIRGGRGGQNPIFTGVKLSGVKRSLSVLVGFYMCICSFVKVGPVELAHSQS